MNLPTQQSYRLVPRGGAGLACDEEGLALGGVDLARAQTDARGVRRCVMRSPDETARILRASYGRLRDETVLRLHQGLGRAAALIEAGELGRAGIQARTAAIAYVWAENHLPFLTSADFSGPKLDAASEAVMREITPQYARAILDDVAVQNRALIMSGHYNPILKVGK